MKIRTSIPASLSNFEVQGQLTKATLKVFHTGITNDRRRFTESFANKLAETIGGTPVVARYDEEKDDFIGHAPTQAIFGFVPESPVIKYEEDSNGNNWLVTDVRLFTKRSDVGPIAQKIIGKGQSLELSPETFKYSVKKDSNGRIEEFVIEDGDLIGLSVLGNSEKPAFGGSGFFSSLLNEGKEEERLEEVIRKYLSIPNYIEIESGGEPVERVIYKGENFTIIEIDGEVFTEFIAADGKLIRKKIEEEEEEVAVIPVPKVEEPEEPGDSGGEEPEPEPEPESDPEPEPEPESEPDPAEPTDPEPTDPEPTEPTAPGDDSTTEDPAIDEGAVSDDTSPDVPTGMSNKDGEEIDNEEPEEGLESEEEKDETDENAFNEADRKELEAYRRAHKQEVIDSYADYISEEIINKFKDRVDSYSIEELEKELSLEAMKVVRRQKEKNTSAGNSFAFTFPLSRETQTGRDNTMSSTERLIEAILEKKNEVE